MMPHSSASSCASRSASNPPPPSSNLWLGVTHRKRQAIHVVVCVFVSSSSSSFVVVVVGGGGRVARRASRAARPHEEQRRAGAGCCELQQRGPNRAPPTAHKVRPPDAPAARRTAGWGCGRIPKRAAHLVDCKATSWERGRRASLSRGGRAFCYLVSVLTPFQVRISWSS